MDEGIPFRKLLYRFLTGLHLDGIKRETHERDTWWTALGRHHRAAWRIGTIVVAVGWTWLILHYRLWTTEVTGMAIPFLLDKAWRAVHRRAAPRRVTKIDVRDAEEVSPFGNHTYREDTRKLLPDSDSEFDLDEGDDYGPIDILDLEA
jgi:hypothetical protein